MKVESNSSVAVVVLRGYHRWAEKNVVCMQVVAFQSAIQITKLTLKCNLIVNLSQMQVPHMGPSNPKRLQSALNQQLSHQVLNDNSSWASFILRRNWWPSRSSYTIYLCYNALHVRESGKSKAAYVLQSTAEQISRYDIIDKLSGRLYTITNNYYALRLLSGRLSCV